LPLWKRRWDGWGDYSLIDLNVFPDLHFLFFVRLVNESGTAVEDISRFKGLGCDWSGPV